MLARKCVLAVCAAVVFVALEQSAKAELCIDLRWESGAKSVSLSARDINKPIPLYVYAQVLGKSSGLGKAETLRSVQGAFVSPEGSGTIAPAGDLDLNDPEGVRVLAGLGDWTGAGASAGKAQDIDGDGDIDLGGKPGAPQADWVTFRTDLPNYGIKAGQGRPISNGTEDGIEFLIGRLTFTPTKLDGWTVINFKFKTQADGTIADDAALWTEDGTHQLFTPANGQLLVSGTSGIPEPSSLWVLGLAGVSLLRHRRI